MSQKRAKQNRQNHQPKPVQLNVNPDDLPDVSCQNVVDMVSGAVCGNLTFIDGKTIKKVSALVSPKGREGYVNVGASVCVKCFAALPRKA